MTIDQRFRATEALAIARAEMKAARDAWRGAIAGKVLAGISRECRAACSATIRYDIAVLRFLLMEKEAELEEWK